MVSIAGDWNVTIKTPIGSLAVVYTFAEHDGVLSGTAVGTHETVALADIVVTDGRRVTWRQTISRPMRLHLHFDVRVEGDHFTGHSRAGRLPRSAVHGARRT